MNGPEVLRFAANLYRVPVEGGTSWWTPGFPGRHEGSSPPPRAPQAPLPHPPPPGPRRGARALWERFRVPVLAHPQEWAYLTKRKPRPPLPLPLLGKALANWGPAIPEEALAPAEEGMEVFGFRVVHLPGHTLGQVGLFREGVLLAGDALRGRGLPPRFINEDHALARRTVRKILELGVKRVYLGHGGPLSGEEVAAIARRLGV